VKIIAYNIDIMNCLLHFRRKEAQEAYDAESLANKLEMQKNYILWAIALSIFGIGAKFIISYTTILSQISGINWNTWAIAIGLIMAYFTVYFIVRRCVTTKNNWIFDIMYLGIFGCSQYISIASLKPESKITSSLVMFTYSITLVSQVLVSGVYMFNLLSRMIYLSFIVVYTSILVENYATGLFYYSLSYQTFVVLLLLYLIEKSNRLSFLKKFDVVKTGDTLRLILNDIPENIVVLDKNLQMVYKSSFFHKMFNEEDNIEVLALLDKIQAINFRTDEILQTVLNTEGPESRRKNQDYISLPTNGSNADSSAKQQLLSSMQLEPTYTLFKLCREAGGLESLYLYLSKVKKDKIKESLVIDCKYKKDKDSQPISLECKISLATFSGEDCIIFILRDTTQRDIIARLADNNEYKDNLLASVSHELRTPLNGTLNFIESAIMSEEIPNSMKEAYLLPAIRSGKLLMHIINDILDYSQINAGKLRLVNTEKLLKETFDESLQLIQLQAAKKGIEVYINYDEQNLPVKFSTDHNRLSQVVLNLLSNALKFTFQGFIKITVAMDNREENIIQVSLEDTGIGINEEDQKKLFRAFAKIDLGGEMYVNSRGVGLGLSISNEIVKLIGTDDKVGIQIQSVPEKGSTFTFKIKEKFNDNNEIVRMKSSESINSSGRPRIPSDQDSFGLDIKEFTAPKPELRFTAKTDFISELNSTKKFLQILGSEATHSSQNFPNLGEFSTHDDPLLRRALSTATCACNKILIVDDDCFNIIALENMLKSIHYKCDIAYNGAMAIEKVMKAKEASCSIRCGGYQLIFMDCMMPIMDGFQATKELRSKLKDTIPPIKIIGCTALTIDKKIKECIQCGMDEVIFKPINRAKLEQLVNSYLK
jgi:signal transduction histidine kinase